MSRMSVVYMGGRQAGCVGLLALLAAGCEILAVVAYDNQMRNLAELLRAKSLRSIREDSFDRILAQADLLVSVHGREVVPKQFLGVPRFGAINVHPCLYAYKGPNPVQRLLDDRNPWASVGVHRMTEQVDQGEVVIEEFINVKNKRNVEEVYNALYPVYASTLLQAIRLIRQGE